MCPRRLALALICNAATALAQQPASQEFESELQQVEDVVVTASPVPRESLAQSIRSITATHAGVVPRFNNPICPKIVGAKPEAARSIAGHVRRVAKLVGAQIAASNCTPNLVILFAVDGQAAIDSLEKSRPDISAAIEPWRWRTMRQGIGPAWAWHATEMRSIDSGIPVDAFARVWIATRLRAPVRWDTTTAFVVIETGWMKNLTISQIGAYAAAASLAPIALDRVSTLQAASIYRLPADIRAGNTGVPGLTRFDVAYLSAIYQSPKGARLPAITATVLHKIETVQ